MRHILALDQGTTSSRAIVFDASGRIVAMAQREFAQHFPQPGWVEHDAMEIWQTQLAVAREALQAVGNSASDGMGSGADAPEIVAIGITNQRETTVLWDRASGEPLAPAIVWQDRRTADACERLRRAGHAGRIRRRTGLELDAYFSATKLAWLLDQVPGARARAARGELAFGTIDSWLVWRLTGGRVHATDASNAARTLLMNLHTLDWDEALLRLLDIPRAVLPRIVPSCGVLGESDPALLGVSLPIAGLAGDQQAATFGQCCFAPGMAKNTYGTGCFMLMNTGDRPVASRHRLLSTVGWQGPAESQQPPAGGACRPRRDGGRGRAAYCLEGSVFIGGAVVQWLRDGLGLIGRSSEVQALASGAGTVDEDLFLVPAFAGLGAPHWDPWARGLLIGITRGTSAAQVARAALEAIALQTADVFDAMAADSGIALAELRVDGGAARDDLLMQLQADLLGVPVVRPVLTETTAFGAAALAGLAVGLWRDAEALQALWRVDRRFEPQMDAAARAARRARWRQAVARARGWARRT